MEMPEMKIILRFSVFAFFFLYLLYWFLSTKIRLIVIIKKKRKILMSHI